MKTTLNKIRSHGPCTEGWTKLLKNLGKTKADDEPLAITTILESNGLDDALWCLRAVDGYRKEMRLFAVECVRSVQHFMAEPKNIEYIDIEINAASSALILARAAADAAADAESNPEIWNAVWEVVWKVVRETQANFLCFICAEIEYQEEMK